VQLSLQRLSFSKPPRLGNVGSNQLDLGTLGIVAGGIAHLPQQLVLRTKGKVRRGTVDVAQLKAAIERGRCVGRVGASPRKSGVVEVEASGALARGTQVNVVVAGRSVRAEGSLLENSEVVRKAGGGAGDGYRLLEGRVRESWRHVSDTYLFWLDEINVTYSIQWRCCCSCVQQLWIDRLRRETRTGTGR
jgi:hypothetical protein